MTSPQPRVWLVTGTTSGFGKEICRIALSHGDKVLAASRNPSGLEELRSAGAIPVYLDQNQSPSKIDADIDAALLQTGGRLDIVVLNAGYVQTGTIEERTHDEILTQFQTNVFGTLDVARAVLPTLRRQRSGVICVIGSVGANVHTPSVGAYHATKAAIKSFSVSLRGEVAGLGIKVTCVEPGHFRTQALDSNMSAPEERIDDYKDVNRGLAARFAQFNGRQRGDVEKGSRVIYEVLTQTGRAEKREIPAVLALGRDCVDIMLQIRKKEIEEIEAWRDISADTDFDDGDFCTL